MEEQNQTTSLFELRIDENTKEEFRGLSRWAMIVAITAMVSLFLTIVEAFAPKKATLEYSGTGLTTKTPGTDLTSVIIGVVISGLLAYFLYQFSVLTKRGVDNINQSELNKGLGNLKSYFMTLGIVFIIIAAIVIIFLLIVSTGAPFS